MDPARRYIDGGQCKEFLSVESEICSAFLESIKKYNNSSIDLTKFIALSPSLSYNILNLSQSSFYSPNGNIPSYNDALKRIGNDVTFHIIKDFLVNSSNSTESVGLKPCINSQYYGSLKSAHLAALISEELKLSSPFTAYVAALLHNIGAVVLSTKFPIKYNRLKTSPAPHVGQGTSLPSFFFIRSISN